MVVLPAGLVQAVLLLLAVFRLAGRLQGPWRVLHPQCRLQAVLLDPQCVSMADGWSRERSKITCLDGNKAQE